MSRKKFSTKTWKIQLFIEVDPSMGSEDVEALVASLVDAGHDDTGNRLLDSYEYEATEA